MAEKTVKTYSAERSHEPSRQPRNGLKIREQIDFFGSLPPDRYLDHVWPRRVKKYSAERPQEPLYRPRNGLKVRQKIDFFGSLPPDRYLEHVWPREESKNIAPKDPRSHRIDLAMG